MKKSYVRMLMLILLVFAAMYGQAQVTANFYPQNAVYNTGAVNATTFTQTSMLRTQCVDIERGFARFDITAIPDAATISSVVLHLYISDDNNAYFKIMQLESDPLVSTTASIFTDCANGNTYSTYSSNFPNPGWYVQDLGTSAVTDLTAKLTSNWFGIGFYEYETSGSYYLTADGWNETNRPYVEVTYTLPATMEYASSTTTQTNTNSYSVAMSNQQIIGVEVVTTGNQSPLTCNSIVFNTNGTTSLTDLANAKLFYTGNSTTFATTTQVGATIADFGALGSSFTIDANQVLTSGTNHFWLTYDLSANATVNNYVDAECTQVTVGNANYNPTVTAPVGNRQIKVLLNKIIGNETFVNASLPIDPYYGYSYSQTVYTKDEIGATKSITKIAYYYTGSAWGPEAIKIYMGHSSRTSFASTTDWESVANLTLVYDGGLTVTANQGWVDLTLATPFSYNGTDNLIIAVDENTSTYYLTADDFYCSPSTTNKSIYYRSDNTNPDPAAPVTASNVSIYYPNIRLEFVPGPMSYVSSTTTQIQEAVLAGATNNEVIDINVVTSGDYPSYAVTNFNLSTSGTTNTSEISNAKLWYTGTISTFNPSTATLLSTNVAPNGAFAVTCNQALVDGTNHFWLSYDVAGNAEEGNVIDARCTSITIDGGVGVKTPTVTNPAGNRVIRRPLTGVYTIDNTLPTNTPAGRNYSNFQDAFDDLNYFGISAGVTFNVSTGQTFTAAASASIPWALILEISGTSSNPIIFQKSATDANPIISFTGTSATTDIGLFLYGSDYITFDGIDFVDAGTSSTNWIERAIYIQGTEFLNNGAQYNTIKNCTIDLSKANTSSYGIYLKQYTGTTVATGTNSYNKFYNNTVQDCYNPYYFLGMASNLDVENEIGTINSGVSVINNIGGSSTAVYGVYSKYQNNLKVYNTEISNIGASTNIYGIYSELNTGVCQFYNNKIHDISTTGAGSTVRGIGIASGSLNSTKIYGNDIYNLSSSTSFIYGISILGGDITDVYNNKIYGLNYSGTSSYSVAGFYITSGTTTNLYNNMLYDISAVAGTLSPSATGFYFAGGTNINVYNNSVLLNYTSTNASNVSAALYSLATPNLDIRNNIFINNTDVTIGLAAYAFRYSTSTFTKILPSTDRNLYYAGTPGTKHILFYDGLTGYQTISAYKTAAATFDQNAVTENVPFVSTSGTYNLHIKTDAPTIVEGNASVVSTPAITTDIDGDVRSVTTPDIGADEGNFIPKVANDVSALAMVTPTNFGAVVANTPIVPEASFTNVGVLDQAGPLTVQYIIKNAGMLEVYNQTQTIASLAVGQVVSVQFPQTSLSEGGVYSVSVSIELAGDGFPANNQLLGSFDVATPLSGNYNIGASMNPPYNTITNALTRLNFVGVADAVSFTLIDANYPSETFPLAINAFAGASDVNKLTIKPAVGVNATIAGTSNTSIIKINGADYVTIEGSNDGTSSRNLTISNNAVSGTIAAVQIASLGTGLGATYVTVKNCEIKTALNTSGSYGISIGAAVNVAGDDNDNITIQNNNIYSSYVGIYSAASSTGTDNDLVISQNIIGNATDAQSIGNRGIEIIQADGVTISNNKIFNLKVGNTPVAVNLSTGVINANILGNEIFDIKYAGTGGYGGRGIYYNSGNATSNTTFANNVIYAVGGDGYTSFSNSSPVGMYFDGTTGGLKIYYNTVEMNGTLTRDAITVTTAILFNSITLTNIDLRNNILVNTMNNTTNINAKNYAIYSTAPSTSFTNINNNDYYVSGSQGKLGYFAAADIVTLADWQTATTQDNLSLNVTPYFVSFSDLHLVTNTNCILNAAGVDVGVTTDFDGEVRTNFDIGADEFTPTAPNAPVSLGNKSACANSTIPSLEATGENIIWYSDLALTNQVGTGASIATGQTVVGVHYYYATQTSCSLESQAVEIVLTINELPSATIGNDAPICSGQSATLTVVPSGGIQPWSVNYTTNGDNPITLSGITVNSSFDVNPSQTSTYAITSVSDANGCVGTGNSAMITVNPLPTISIDAVQDLCYGNTNFVIPVLETTYTPTTYTITAGTPAMPQFTSIVNSILPSGNIIVDVDGLAATGEYQFELTVSNANGCQSQPVLFTVTVNPTPSITVDDVASICNDENSFEIPVSNPINDPITYTLIAGTPAMPEFTSIVNATLPNGNITVAVNEGIAAGTYEFILTVSNVYNCQSQPLTFTVTVNAIPTITLGTEASVCEGSSSFAINYTSSSEAPTLFAIFATSPSMPDFESVDDATFTTSPLMVTIPTTTDPGTYGFEFAVQNANGCVSVVRNISLTINPLPEVSFEGLSNFYTENDAPVTLTGNPIGGTFSGDGIINETQFDPSLFSDYDEPVYTSVTYTVTNDFGCTSSQTKQTRVFLDGEVEFTIDGEQTNWLNGVDFCIYDSPVLLIGTPIGGLFAGVGISGNQFAPTSAGEGVHTIYYIYVDENGNEQEVQHDINVVATPVVTFDAINPVCANTPEFVLSQASVPSNTYGAGIYSGTAVDSISGTFNPTVAGVGTHTITYTFTEIIKACVGSATQQVEVLELPSVTLTPIAPQCVDANPFYISVESVNPAGGFGLYSGNGVDTEGNFIPSVVGVGSDTIIYSYIALSGCTNTDTIFVTVNALPSVTFSPIPSVCVNSPAIDLSALGTPVGGEFSGLGVENSTFTPNNSGTYYLSYTVTDANCSATAVSSLVVNALPSFAIDAVDIVCQNATSFQVYVTNNDNSNKYSIDTINSSLTNFVKVEDAPLTSDTIVVSLPAGVTAGTYSFTMTVKNANACESMSQTFNLIVNPLPVANAGSDLEICAGNAVALFANGGVAYSWNNDVEQGVEFTPAATSTYTVTVTDANGCVNTDNLQVTVNPLPVANAGDDITVCEGSSVTLHATGGVRYTWSNNAVQDVAFLADTSITFNVTVFDGNGCSSTDNLTLTVNGLPSVQLLPIESVCASSSSFEIKYASTENVPTTYTLASNDLPSFVIIENAQFTESPLLITLPDNVAAGNYTFNLTTSNANDCLSDVQQFTLHVTALPDVNAGDDFAICSGVDTVLRATSSVLGVEYTWNNGVIQSIPFVPLATATYVATATDQYNCSATDMITVTVNALPIVTLAPQPSAGVCESAVALVGGLPVGGEYSGTFVQNNTFDASSAGVGTQSIFYFYTDIATGCSNSATDTIAVDSLPVVAFEPLDAVGICNAPFALIGGLVGDLPIGTYSGDGVSNNQFNPAAAGVGEHNIMYSFTDAHTCSASAVQIINVVPLPTVTFANLPSVGICAPVFTLTGGLPLGGTYTGTGVAANQFNPSAAGVGTFTITYTYTNQYACSQSATQTIIVTPLPTVTFVLADNSVCVNNEDVVLTGATPVGGVFSGAGVVNGMFKPTVAGAGSHVITYTVVASNGCANSATQTMVVNALPNVTLANFTPVCNNASSFALVGGLPAGGTYSGEAVVNNVFFPIDATAGNVAVTYTFTDNNSCVNSAVKNIVVNTVPVITVPQVVPSVCLNTAPINLNDIANGGVFSGDSITNNVFDPQAAGVGIANITYTMTSDAGCFNSVQISVMVNDLPQIIFDSTVICSSAGVVALDLAIPQGGTYSGVGVVNGTQYNPVGNAGSHPLTYSFTGSNGCASTLTQNITVDNPTVEFGENVTGNSYTFNAQSGFAEYQWYRNNLLLPQTTQSLNVTTSGSYKVVVTSTLGCTASDEVFFTKTSIGSLNTLQAKVQLYPNPADDKLFVTIESEIVSDYRFEMLNTQGQVVLNGEMKNVGSDRIELNVSALAVGVYYLKVIGKDGVAIEKVVIK